MATYTMVSGFERFVAKVREASTSVTIVYVAINLSLLHQNAGLAELDQQVNGRIKEVCEKDASLEFLDPWSKDSRLTSDDSLYLFDGLHFNRPGYEVLASVMKPLLEPLWEKVKDRTW